MLLTTPRLRICSLTPSDAPTFFTYRSHPDVVRYQNLSPERLEDAASFIAKTLGADFEVPGTWCQLGIRLLETDELIGDLGLHRIDTAQAEIGFTIAPPHQRKGYAHEATRAILSHLFDTLELHRVIASLDPNNTASKALLERLGFRQEAHHRQSYWFRGQWVDDVICAVLRSEWNPHTP